jgi:hypothetical protein
MAVLSAEDMLFTEMLSELNDPAVSAPVTSKAPVTLVSAINSITPVPFGFNSILKLVGVLIVVSLNINEFMVAVPVIKVSPTTSNPSLTRNLLFATGFFLYTMSMTFFL